MRIINPLYDNAFKYLMDNEEVAKIVLSIILNTKVKSLQSKPQETPVQMLGNISLSRFDFKAIICNEAGENFTVLIEIQKYKYPNPIQRFRSYLAQNYAKEETIINEKGEEIKITLPIISIYILGFDLPEFPSKAIRIDNSTFDLINNESVVVKSSFIELLTHKSFVLLADRPKGNPPLSRLEKFLNLFLQKLEGKDSNQIIDVETETEDDKELQKVMEHLRKATFDEELLRRVKAEEELIRNFVNLEKAKENALLFAAEAQRRETEERREKEEAQKEKAEAQQREAEAQQREAEAQQREADERREKEEAIKSLQLMIKLLLAGGKTIKEIAELLSKSEDEINRILTLK